MKELRILSPTAILGYGFPLASFEAGMEREPHVIAVDAGSTDPGPFYLGAGISFTDRNSVKRDLEIMIPAGINAKIPVIIGSAGGAGGRPHVELTLDIIKEIAEEKKLNFKLAVIQSEFDKDFIRNEFLKGNISPLYPAEELTEDAIDQAVRIVAQMGEEPFIEALNSGADVILAGRSYDPSVFACLAVREGFDKGLALHLGKILECAAITCIPGSGSDCMFGYLREDGFILEPLSPERKCTTLSVAAHTLYEKTNPYELPGPGGKLNLYNTSFEQISDNRVFVTGTKFESTQEYAVKLEGVRRVGFRTISCAATKDPIMIENIDDIVANVRKRVDDNFKHYDLTYFLDFKIYGKNGVMSLFEGLNNPLSHELMIIIEAVAPTQDLADTICGFTRSTMLHYGYEGRISTAGNLAFPFSPSDCKVGEVFEFSIYHLLKVADPLQPFPIEYLDIKN